MTLVRTLLVTEPVAFDAPRGDTIGPVHTITVTRPPLLSRLIGAWKAVATALRRLRLPSWDMADPRTQKRDPMGELIRHFPMLPLML